MKKDQPKQDRRNRAFNRMSVRFPIVAANDGNGNVVPAETADSYRRYLERKAIEVDSLIRSVGTQFDLKHIDGAKLIEENMKRYFGSRA